jgi:hypothetical protein
LLFLRRLESLLSLLSLLRLARPSSRAKGAAADPAAAADADAT